MMTSNLFVIANVKQLRTGGSFRILLPFFQTSWGVGVLNSTILTVFIIGLSLARFWRAFGISGVFEPPNPSSPRYTTDETHIYRSAFSVNMYFIMWRCHISSIGAVSLKCTNIWRRIGVLQNCQVTNHSSKLSFVYILHLSSVRNFSVIELPLYNIHGVIWCLCFTFCCEFVQFCLLRTHRINSQWAKLV